MKIIQAYQYQENDTQFNATAYGNVSIYEYRQVVTLDNDTNVFVFNSSNIIKPSNCLDMYCLVLEIKWSGDDAVVNLEFNGTMPYSVNDQVTDFMHIVDKNGSRRIGGLK
uniref:Uncharacterized protein n=1 Tax=Acrobeloides nanus TaxID=290746 RepID=A0A914ER14_9BILA